MKHPYNIEHSTYLRDLEVAASRNRNAPIHKVYSADLKNRLRGMSVVGVVVALGAFIPWGNLPI